uniref:FACT complex subunit SSRP1 n=1 Tax=Solanum lycopersicum TaxID=4081 RepID=A0A3Q7F8U5_SOLLC
MPIDWSGSCWFDGIAILTPRLAVGYYNVELHLSFLHLHGQANDFKIQYNSLVRVFCLYNSNRLLCFCRLINHTLQ